MNHDNQEGSNPEAGGGSNDSSESTIKKRKDQLDSMLRTYRHAKMNKRLPPDSQITGIAKEELELKKTMAEKMVDRMDKVHQDHLSTGMDKINTAIESFASILRSMIPQQPQFYHHMAQHLLPYIPCPSLLPCTP